MFGNVPNAIVLTMEGSATRHDALAKQLDTYRPCRNVYIQYNNGTSGLSPPSDLFEAFLTAVRFASEKSPSTPVLILEDDVYFNVKRRDDLRAIDDFLTNNESWQLYSLGSHTDRCIPHVCRRHVPVRRLFSSHAWFVNVKTLARTLTSLANDVHSLIETSGIGHDTHLTKFTRNWMFHHPIAFQTHPDTENSREWMTPRLKLTFGCTGAHRDGQLFYHMGHMSTHLGGSTFALVGCPVVMVGLMRVLFTHRRYAIDFLMGLIVIWRLWLCREYVSLPVNTSRPNAGDIVYFKQTKPDKDLGIAAMRHATRLYCNTLYDHVGVVIERDDEVYVAEFVPGRYNKRELCTRITPFSERVRTFHGTIALRRRHTPSSKDEKILMNSFVDAHIDQSVAYKTGMEFWNEHIFHPSTIPKQNTSCKSFVYNTLYTSKQNVDRIIFPRFRRYSTEYNWLERYT